MMVILVCGVEHVEEPRASPRGVDDALVVEGVRSEELQTLRVLARQLLQPVQLMIIAA